MYYKWFIHSLVSVWDIPRFCFLSIEHSWAFMYKCCRGILLYFSRVKIQDWNCWVIRLVHRAYWLQIHPSWAYFVTRAGPSGPFCFVNWHSLSLLSVEITGGIDNSRPGQEKETSLSSDALKSSGHLLVSVLGMNHLSRFPPLEAASLFSRGLHALTSFFAALQSAHSLATSTFSGKFLQYCVYCVPVSATCCASQVCV